MNIGQPKLSERKVKEATCLFHLPSETSGSTAASPAGLNVMVIVIDPFFSLLSRKIK
jgi:hypothetical protein